MKRNKRQKEKVILAFDPSMTAFGWVVFSIGGECLDAGCIKTESGGKKSRIRKGDDRCRRIHEMNMELLRLCKTYQVLLIVSEQPHGSQSAIAATMLGITLGMIQTLADVLNIPLEWYAEGECKKQVLGKRTATKLEMIKAIEKLYRIPFQGVQYKDEAMADATAVYHFAMNNSSTAQFLKQLN